MLILYMTKKKQKRPLNTYIGGSRSNKKKTKRNVLGITGGEGEEESGEFGVIWLAYEGLNTAIKGMDAGKIGNAVISAARRFVVSTMIVVLQSKSTIEKFMKANNIEVPPEIQDVKFDKVNDKAFILLFKTDKTSREDMENAYNACLKSENNGVVKKLKSKFKEVIEKLSKQTTDISSQPGAGKVFNDKINSVKKEVSMFDMQGTTGILETVENEINKEQETTTAAADTVEGEVSVVEDAGEEAGAETTTEAGAETTTEAGTGTSTETSTETSTAEPKKSYISKISGFFNRPAAPAEKPAEEPTPEPHGGSRKKRKYHKRKYRKSSQRKK